jgi:hypothetical protein
MSSPITTGFINEKHGRTRAQKMTWTTANDRKLLLIGLGKEISPKEYAIIAGSFPGKYYQNMFSSRQMKVTLIHYLQRSRPQSPSKSV